MATTTKRRAHLDVEAIRQSAAGRWPEIIAAVGGVDHDLLDGRHHPCPQCGGTDRFRLIDAAAGALYCNGCFSTRNGDGFAAIGWLRSCDFPAAVKLVANHLGLADRHEQNGHAAPIGKAPTADDVLADVCRAKRMPVASAIAYGAAAKRWGRRQVVEVPVYGPDGAECSRFAIPLDGGKGLFAKGKPAGLFLPHGEDGKVRLPQPGETWATVEGVKDAAALHGLGYHAVGLPTSAMNAKFARLFQGVDVVLVPDLDTAGQKGAAKTAARLRGIAASVKIARLPGEMRESGGLDVRDVLALPDGEALVRQAIDDSQAAGEVVRGRPENVIANFEEVEVEGENGDTEKIRIPLAMSDIIDEIHEQTGHWPRRVDNMLFVDDPQHGLDYFDRRTTAGLFGWLRRRGPVKWARGGDYVAQAELFAEIERTARRYDAIELLPHEPPTENIYYRGSAPPPGDGSHLRKLLDRFRPETTIDRDLIQAAFLTAFWGGLPGCRPVFVVTSDDGRGVGKSKVPESIAHLCGGAIDVSANEEIGTLKARLLSPDARTKRIAILDNVKSLRFSWAELEALITSPVISGRQLYVGEGQRPNLLTWCVTLNGVSMATDMAQRSVIIKVVRGKNAGPWWEETRQFIDQHRQAIIGDVIGALRAEPYPLAEFSRWATWEQHVLCRLPEPGETQKLILERQGEADCELDEAGIIEEHFAEQLAWLGYDPATAQVRIPVAVAARWYGCAVGEQTKTAAASKRLHQLANEGQGKRIAPDPSRTYGRCFIWTGSAADVVGRPIENDLQYRIARQAKANT